MNSLANGPWKLADLNQVEKNGLTVFSCFHCGGGSTMGYKLAGYTVLGGVEIDPEMSALYVANHKPSHEYMEAIQDFRNRETLPKELMQLDILDGSPPCSVFSMAGDREKKWGTESHFREGQRIQRLDDLFFHFIQLGHRLQPKVIVAENVKGLIIGNAKGYVAEIFQAFREAGYRCQLFLLNASRMGVPQARERTFFVAIREDLPIERLNLAFNEPTIGAAAACEGVAIEEEREASAGVMPYLKRTAPGRALSKAHPKGSMFNLVRLHPDRPSPTVTATCPLYHWQEPRRITQAEAIRLQTFPDDYNRLDSDMRYVCGMSVPPFMMQRVALEIGRQVFGIGYQGAP